MNSSSGIECIEQVGRGAVPLVSFLLFTGLERTRPLRRVTHPKWQRLGVNFGFMITGGVCFALSYSLCIAPAIRWAALHDWGVIRWVGIHGIASVGLSVIGLDYTLWWWHRLNHRVPLLWRFHRAHHADVELDASTALRFHFVELLLSVPVRIAQAVLIGIDLPVMLAWEGALLVFVQFHHSNVQLPVGFERVLRLLMITPRLHGIHHSVVHREQSSNLGTVLTLWDLLHRTHRWGIADDQTTIGIAEIRATVPLCEALLMPFSSRATRLDA